MSNSRVRRRTRTSRALAGLNPHSLHHLLTHPLPSTLTSPSHLPAHAEHAAEAPPEAVQVPHTRTALELPVHVHMMPASGRGGPSVSMCVYVCVVRALHQPALVVAQAPRRPLEDVHVSEQPHVVAGVSPRSRDQLLGLSARWCMDG